MKKAQICAAAALLAVLFLTSEAFGKPLPEVLKGPTAVKTARGVTFTAPMDWTREVRGTIDLLLAPEGDVRLAVVDEIEAKDADAAAASAWLTLDGKAQRKPQLLTPRPAPRLGWDERVAVSYETSPNEKRVIEAFALRAGQRWTVILLDAREATLDKRGAAVDALYASINGPDYTRENLSGRIAHRLDAARIEQLKDFLRRGMSDLGVPGVGLALVDRQRVLFAGGLGVKELGKPDLVDAHTLFMVASNTKGMSTLMLATLVDDGLVKWDQPVTAVYPDFKLGSAATTEKTLLRHLVCACTGLPRKDVAWFANTPRDTPAANTFALLADTEPTSGFGELFQYNNLITTAGGLIGGALANPGLELGVAYDRAMQKRVFDPLGMADTTFSFADALAGNVARPHGMDVDGKTARSSHDLSYSIVPYRPAGGAWSSVQDMARYAQLELNEGVLPDGTRPVSRANLLERRKRGVSTGDQVWYGMGLEENAYSGVSIISHGGSMPGYQTNFYVIPDADIAAVLLTNSDAGARLLSPFSRRLLEVLFDAEPQAAATVASTKATVAKYVADNRKKLTLPPDPTVLAKLPARYQSTELGTLKLVRSGQNATLQFTDWESAVATRKNDDGTVSLVLISPSISGIALVIGEDQGKTTLTIREAQHEYLYLESP